MNMKSAKNFKTTIIGDNIIECERALDILVSALGVSSTKRLAAASIPLKIVYEGSISLEATLLPGFGRWGDNYWESEKSSSQFVSENPDALVLVTAESSEGNQVSSYFFAISLLNLYCRFLLEPV